jgi:DNA replication protein DnaC
VTSLPLPRLPEGVVPAEDWPHRLGESPEEAAERQGKALERRRASWQARVPRRFQTATLDDLTADQGAQVLRRWWPEAEVLTLLLRSGSNGVGKTHAAYAVGNDAVEHGAWAAAWTMIGLNDALRPGGDLTAYDTACMCDLLVVDDLGRERISEWTLERLTGVLDARWTARRRTVLTTRLTGDQFVERYGGSISDRVRDDAWIVEVKGESRRGPAPW